MKEFIAVKNMKVEFKVFAESEWEAKRRIADHIRNNWNSWDDAFRFTGTYQFFDATKAYALEGQNETKR